MKRRELLVGAGVALAAVATRTEAAPSKPANNLPAAATSCVRLSQACLRHCLDMFSKGNTTVASCAKAVADLIPTAGALADIAAGGSTHTKELAAVVSKIAFECKTECDKHPAMEPCKACSDSCAALIAEIGKA